MKTLFAPIVVACTLAALVPSIAPAAAGWTDNYSKAQAQSKSENKLLLLDFTGSDWCMYCQKLNKEVFSTAEFKKYATDHLVLMEVDFPVTKELPQAVTAQNEKLQSKYGIDIYPTVVVLNSMGKKVGEIGYQEGGPKAFIAELEKLKGK